MSNSLSRNGSATVQWVDTSGNVIIKNFHVRSDGQLLVSAFNGQNWSTSATPISGIETDDLHKGGFSSISQSAISAFSVNTGTSGQKIHVFYPTSNQLIQSSIWQLSSNTWISDSAFNKQNFRGNPRAAITWKDANGIVQFRVYHVTYQNDASQPLINGCNVYEISGTDGGSWQYSNNGQPIIGTIRQNGSAFSDAVAAVTWTVMRNNQPEQQLRVYVYEGLWLQEYVWKQSKGWVYGKSLEGGYQDQMKRYPIAAVQFFQSGKLRLRIYRNTYLPLGKNYATEWAFDEGAGGDWSTNHLPSGVIHNTDGEMQPSAIAWTDPTDNSKVHIRLYQNRDKNDDGKPGVWIEENLYDTSGNTWIPSTQTLDGINA